MDNPYQSPALQTSEPTFGSKPITATVFGILNTVFGTLGMLFNVGILTLAIFSAGGIERPEMPDILTNPAREILNRVNMFVSGLLSVVLIAAGIGLLKFRPWGRTLSNLWGAANLVMLVIAFVAHAAWLLPALQNFDSLESNGPKQAAVVVAASGAIAGSCLGTIYPILLLIFVNRRSFREKIYG